MTVARDAEVFRDVAVPMRDGTILRADVYLPTHRQHPLPSVVMRTPYGKRGPLTELSDVGRIAAAGYAVIVQDKRGRFASEGDYAILRDDSAGEHQDGFDTVEWVADQAWSDGVVFAHGLSYLGHTALGAAIADPPHLRGAMAIQASSDEYTERTFRDGVLRLENVADWAAGPLVAPDLIERQPESERASLSSELDEYWAAGEERFERLPLSDWPYLRRIPMFWEAPLSHREDPEYFAENRLGPSEAERIRVPVTHVGGWFDFFPRSTVRHFELSSERRVPDDRLIVGPWAHGALQSDTFDGMHCPDSAADANAILLGVLSRRSEGLPPARAVIYVLGAQRWRAEPEWPIPGTRTTPLYLGADGVLTIEPGDEGRRRYAYDPADPYRAPGVIGGPKDVSGHHSGENVLVYATEPLEHEWEITGTPRAVLHAESSATDTDWVIEMNVVGTDGRSRIFDEGISRARYRHGRERPCAVEPGSIERYEIELRPISLVVRPGERVEVVVTSGKFPAYERNPNAYVDLDSATEADFVVAHNVVLSGGDRASHIELPIVPASARGTWIDNPWPLIARDPTAVVERAAGEL